MYRWLAVLFLGILLLPLAPVTAQEFYESPYVILVQATKCNHNPKTTGQSDIAQVTRFQTGFRVKGKSGIFTALHGLADCDSIYTLSGGYQSLAIFEVDVDRDVARLCIAKDEQTEPYECIGDSLTDGFTPATVTDVPLGEVKIVGHPAGSPGQYTIESIKTVKTSTDTLASLVGATLAFALEERGSPLPSIRVIPLQSALAAGLSGAPVLTVDDQLIGIGDGSQAEGLSWLIPWSDLQPISVVDAESQLDRLRNLKPSDFFLNATINHSASAGYVTYSGAVRSSGNNQPVTDAKVIVRLGDQSHRVYTDSEGEFLVRLRVSTNGEQLSGTMIVEKDGYITYTDNIGDLLQQGEWQDIRLMPTVRPRPTTLRRGIYVRVAVLEGANYYQSYTTDTPIDSFAPNVLLVLVDGPEQRVDATWWKVRRLEEKEETAVWMPVATGQMVYIDAIDRFGRNDCVSTNNRLPFQKEAGFDAEFVMLEKGTLLRIMSSRFVEMDDALWVQVTPANATSEVGWVEYVGTGGVNLELENECTPIPPVAHIQTPTATPRLALTTPIPTSVAPIVTPISITVSTSTPPLLDELTFEQSVGSVNYQVVEVSRDGNGITIWIVAQNEGISTNSTVCSYANGNVGFCRLIDSEGNSYEGNSIVINNNKNNRIWMNVTLPSNAPYRFGVGFPVRNIGQIDVLEIPVRGGLVEFHDVPVPYERSEVGIGPTSIALATDQSFEQSIGNVTYKLAEAKEEGGSLKVWVVAKNEGVSTRSTICSYNNGNVGFCRFLDDSGNPYDGSYSGRVWSFVDLPSQSPFRFEISFPVRGIKNMAVLEIPVFGGLIEFHDVPIPYKSTQ